MTANRDGRKTTKEEFKAGRHNARALQAWLERQGEAMLKTYDNPKIMEQAKAVGQALKAVWQGKATITSDLIEQVELLTKLMGFSVRWAREVVEEMPAKDAKEYLMDQLSHIGRDTYEENGPGTPEGFAEYTFRMTASRLEILLLLAKYDLTGEFMRGVKIFAREVYKPDDEPQQAEPLPKLPKKPNKVVMNIDKMFFALCNKSIINGGKVALDVMPKDGIRAYVVADYMPDTGRAPFNLSPTEVCVLDAVNSMFTQAEKNNALPLIFTPASIYKAMPGGGGKLNKAMAEKIFNAVENTLSVTRITLDATDQLRQAGVIGEGEKFFRRGNILSTTGAEYRQRNGTSVYAWKLLEKPIPLEYASLLKQVATIPAHYVEIEGVDPDTGKLNGPLKMTDTRRAMVAFLVRRVARILRACKEAMRMAEWKKYKAMGWNWYKIMTAPKSAGGLQTSDIILFEAAFNAALIESTTKTAIKDNKDFCRDVMRYWQAVGFIHGFNDVKRGREFTGIQLTFNEIPLIK